MHTESHKSTMVEPIEIDVSHCVDDVLIEKIWGDSGKRMTREYIREVALDAAAEFRDAKITAFLPVLIYRTAIDRLKNHNQNHANSEEGDNSRQTDVA